MRLYHELSDNSVVADDVAVVGCVENITEYYTYKTLYNKMDHAENELITD